ncbi:GSCOCG00010824001-RA-CDS [Cotesia congregata]|nr:GSCOCG00010824001-RA-CDS [Cotesia congregata]
MTTMRNIDRSINFWFDIFLRAFLALLIVTLERTEPFNRKIHDDEVWLYKNPKTLSYVPVTVLWVTVFIVPMVVISVSFLIHRDKIDFAQALLAVTLALGLNGVLTNIIKIIVGKPRPDYFWRCFPDGIANAEFNCTGDSHEIRDGKKSFPSGHSSFAFTSFGFVAYYLAGVALCIALSRTCDYHHHWQDVVVGSTIGIFISYMCYRHYYPPLDSQLCHKPYAELIKEGDIKSIKAAREDEIKWI